MPNTTYTPVYLHIWSSQNFSPCNHTASRSRKANPAVSERRVAEGRNRRSSYVPPTSDLRTDFGGMEIRSNGITPATEGPPPPVAPPMAMRVATCRSVSRRSRGPNPIRCVSKRFCSGFFALGSSLIEDIVLAFRFQGTSFRMTKCTGATISFFGTCGWRRDISEGGRSQSPANHRTTLFSGRRTAPRLTFVCTTGCLLNAVGSPSISCAVIATLLTTKVDVNIR